MKLLHTSPATLNLLLISATLLCFLLSLCTGSADVSVGKGVADALHHATSMESLIVMELRLPRALLALFIGGTLGMAGAALQGMLRNPLAEPGIIGVSNGAALGAVVMFYFGFASLGWFLLPLGGLLGACVAVLCLVLLVPHNSNVLTLILAGIAINAIGSALIALALNFAPSPYAMQEIVYWLLGSVTNRSLHDVAIALPFMATGWLMMLRCGSFLDALTLGEDTAQSLGFNVRRLALDLGRRGGGRYRCSRFRQRQYRFCRFGSAACIAAFGWLLTQAPAGCELLGRRHLAAAGRHHRTTALPRRRDEAGRGHGAGRRPLLPLLNSAHAELLVMSSVPLLAGQSLAFAIDGIDIVRDIHLQVRSGELVGLIGPNGAGKSTLLRLLCGIESATQGEVFWQGSTLNSLSLEARARHIGYLAQGARAQWPVSVERVVALGRLPHRSLWHKDSAADQAAIEQALQMAEVVAYRQRIATTLSGGEQTLVMLARIFATQPQLIFADEPVAALDPYHQLHVMELLRAHAHGNNAGVVVLHDLSLAARYCDRLYLFNHGSIFCSGSPATVLTQDNLRTVYGIDSRIECSAEGVSVTPTRRVRQGHP
jgi:ABC-type cobalamin/Fe3+-siderophores transport system ATPase subunit/ABC-type Fe3+-siderophore transport system permease subunit